MVVEVEVESGAGLEEGSGSLYAGWSRTECRACGGGGGGGSEIARRGAARE